ncbi:MAG: protein-L-isoaspartate(D-aspartate) O-methyltransferase [Deltaproteobacteria bacterium]|nr:protein-L-isoaspartate(D-aspartate) O-methyltransferase [Deltaproteobacteria bacterium]
MPRSPDPTWFSAQRTAMVAGQLRLRDISDEAILAAMGRVPRHRFLPSEWARQAYEDHPVDIGHGQTISQPYMVAYMAQLIAPQADMTVLDVGAGSGYQSAVLAEIVQQVWAVERISDLAENAKRVLMELGYSNVNVLVADGSLGLPEHAPYDAILVGAGAPEVPGPLVEQLADGGKLVVPVGGRGYQRLTLVENRGGHIMEHTDLACRFVDLIGRYGHQNG